MVKITPLQSNKGQFAFNISNHCLTTLNYLHHEVPLDVLQQFVQCFFLLNLLLTFLNISLLFSKINRQANDQYDNPHFFGLCILRVGCCCVDWSFFFFLMLALNLHVNQSLDIRQTSHSCLITIYSLMTFF